MEDAAKIIAAETEAAPLSPIRFSLLRRRKVKR